MSRKVLVNDFTSGSIFKQLIFFSAPLMLSGILQTSYNIVDIAVVGRAVGSNCLSGVSIGGDITHTLLFFAIGFSNAGQVLIAQQLGAKKMDQVGKTVGNLITFLLAVAIGLSILAIIFRKQILVWMNTPPEAWDYAWSYVTIAFIGTVFVYGYNLIGAILRGMGDSTHPLLFIVIATVINIILDILFVNVFSLGAGGVALATTIAQGVSFIWALLFLYKKRNELGFKIVPKSFVLEKHTLMPIIKLGIPMALQSALINLSRMFVLSNINSYGITAAAISSIGSKVDNAAVIITNSINTAGASLIGQNIGAGKYDRVKQIIAREFIFCGAVCAVMILVLVIFPKAIFGLFISEAVLIEEAMVYIPVAVVGILSCAARQPMMSLIYGSGVTKMNLFVALFDGVVARIGLSLVLAELFNMGLSGYWYGNAFSGFVPLFIGGIFFLSGKWKTKVE